MRARAKYDARLSRNWEMLSRTLLGKGFSASAGFVVIGKLEKEGSREGHSSLGSQLQGEGFVSRRRLDLEEDEYTHMSGARNIQWRQS